MVMIRRFTLPNAFRSLFFLLTITLILSYSAFGQSLTAGSVSGTVTDPNNAVVPNATVTIENAVTGYKRSVNTGTDGAFRFENVPFNNYVYGVSAAGFSGARGSINIRTSVPIPLTIPLAVSTATETVTITT